MGRKSLIQSGAFAAETALDSMLEGSTPAEPVIQETSNPVVKETSEQLEEGPKEQLTVYFFAGQQDKLTALSMAFKKQTKTKINKHDILRFLADEVDLEMLLEKMPEWLERRR